MARTARIAVIGGGIGGLTAAQQNAIQSQPLYKESGSSAGLQIAPTAHLGIHF